MGVIQSKKYTKNNPASQIDIDFKKEIQNQLKIITCWSLQQIRQLCLSYARYSFQCPYLSRFTFKKIMPFSSTISGQIFDNFAKGQNYVCFYEIFCAILLTCYNTVKRKLQFMYLIYNFTHDQSLKFKHFLLMYESMTYAYCKITDQMCPNPSSIQKYLMDEYLKSDSAQILQRNFQFRKLLQEVQMNALSRGLFQRFQCDIKEIKQKPFVYMLNGLPKYTKQQSDRIFNIIKKVYQQKDYSYVIQYEKDKRFRLENRKINCLQQVQDDKQKSLLMTKVFKIKDKQYAFDKFNIIKNTSLMTFKQQLSYKNNGKSFNGNININLSQSKLISRKSMVLLPAKLQKQFPQIGRIKSISKFQTNKISKLNPLQQNSDNFRIKSYNSSKKIQKKNRIQMSSLRKNNLEDANPQSSSPIKLKQTLKKISPVVFLGGKAYTKQAFFQTIEYFNTLSNNKQQIKIKEFFKTFQNKTFLKRQLSSLFNFFDKNKNGSISFQQFIKATYPNIDKKLFQKLEAWNIEYKNIYQADKIIINKKPKKVKIELPAETTHRIKEIFQSFGASVNGQKNYLIYQDIRAAFKTGFSIQECENLIKQYGVDGKIYIDGFTKMIVPEQFVIDDSEREFSEIRST